MSLEYLESSGLTNAALATSEAIENFNAALVEMHDATNDLLDSWIGKGRDEFSTQTTLISIKLEDISDELYEVYNALVQAEKTFIDADIAEAKRQSIEQK